MGHAKSIKLRGRTITFSIYDFIEAVRSQALLWDRNHPSYNNRDKREIAWLAVARLLSIQIDESNESEKHKAVLLLTKRWKNTRDSFLRSQRRFPDDERDPKTYVYQQELSFLLPDQPDGAAAAEQAPSSGEGADVKAVVQLDDAKTAIHAQVENVAKSTDPAAADDAAASEGANPAEVASRRPKPASARRVGSRKRRLPTALRPWSAKKAAKAAAAAAAARIASPSHVQALLEAGGGDDDDEDDGGFPGLCEAVDEGGGGSFGVAATAAESDPDQSFFDSIKPVVRGMSVEQKLDFQIEILKLLKDFRSRK